MEILISRSGHKIPLINQIPLHSKIDPSKESENFTRDIDFSKKIIVIGLGFGYHLTELVKKKSDFIVIEPDKNLLDAFKRENPVNFLPRILSGGLNEILLKLDDCFHEKSAKEFVIKAHQASLRANPQCYEAIYKAVYEWQAKKILNLITDSSFAPLWISNCYKNLKLPLNAPEIQNMNGNPAIILGSGFTLTQSLPWVKKNQKKLFIIAIPPVLEILLREKITPDLVLLVDGGYANRFYLKKVSVPLISYLFSSHAFIKRWQGDVFFLNGGIPADNFLIPEFPQIPLSGSAASTAIELACAVSNKIYIAGYDFSFVNKHYHYAGNPLEKELLMESGFFQTLEKKNLDLMERGQSSSILNYLGKTIKTNLGMASYYQDFCARIAEKDQKQFFILSEETALFKKVQLDSSDLSGLKDKKIVIRTAPIQIPIKERLMKLKEAYAIKDISHPVIHLQLTRALLKKQDYQAEMDQSFLKIKSLLEII